MLQSIEKTFDSAFFNANHNLKYLEQFLYSLDDGILSDDLRQQLERPIKNITDQLSVLAFCFSQLMCKTILFSENCFILKERFQQLQMENFHLKSDKSFMDFFRKMNQIYSTSTNHHQNNFIGATKHHKKSSVDNKQCPNSTAKNNNVSISSKNKKKTLYDVDKQYYDYDPDNFENNLVYNLKEQLEKQSNMDNHLGQNYNQESKFKIRLRLHTYYNNNAFRIIYKNFKETELINNLRSRNIDCQREIVLLENELSTYRLMVRYLNNQLSGRIQQIQLLTRDRKDDNFNQVWNDLESEISLNKFKTITQALNSNCSANEPGILLDMFQLNLTDSDDSLFETTATSNVKMVIEDRQDPQIDNPNNNQKLMETGPTLLPMECKNFRKCWFNVGLFRFVIVDLNEKALGISITGGKEYGLPILISKIYDQSPAQLINAFNVGDIILSVNMVDLTDMTHDQAVNLLKNLTGVCRFGVIYMKLDSNVEDQQQQQPMLTNGLKTNADKLHRVSTGNELNEIQELCLGYYRSLFNSTLIWPYHFTSDDDDDTSSDNQSLDNDDHDNDQLVNASDASNQEHCKSPNKQRCCRHRKRRRAPNNHKPSTIGYIHQVNDETDSVNSNKNNHERPNMTFNQRRAVPGIARPLIATNDLIENM